VRYHGIRNKEAQKFAYAECSELRVDIGVVTYDTVSMTSAWGLRIGRPGYVGSLKETQTEY
jgi:hypothetical protein